MTKQEITTNIERLENTIKMNCWNKGYVINCQAQIEKYKTMLINMWSTHVQQIPTKERKGKERKGKKNKKKVHIYVADVN